MKNLLILFCLALGINAGAQVAINTDGSDPDNSAMLDIKSSSKGLLIPRMTQSQRNSIPSPPNSLMIYQTDNTPGFYYNSGNSTSPVWGPINITIAGWSLTGNSGTSSTTNFIGTTDNVPLTFKVNNHIAGKIDHLTSSTSWGYQALPNTTGVNNTAIGNFSLTTNTNGYNNSAVGLMSLFSNTTGNDNVCIGFTALYANTTGYFNVANGNGALSGNLTGYSNVAIGYNALKNNVGGNNNIAMGYESGTTGSPNNTISIGNNGWLNASSNQVFIGNASTWWIGGWVGWSIFSDARIKNNIKEDVKGLDFITRLRPVTYHRSIKAMTEITGNKETGEYPEKYDVEKIKYSGFIAQEVEQAAQESGYDFSGIKVPKDSKDLYALSYEQFVVPLVKGMQEQQEMIVELKQSNEELRLSNEELKKTLEQLILRVGKLEGK